MYNSIESLMDALTAAGLEDAASQVANFDSIADILKVSDDDLSSWADGVEGERGENEEGEFLILWSPNEDKFEARDAG